VLLVAVRLAIAHPRTGARLTFEIPTPREFEEAMGGGGASVEGGNERAKRP